MHLKKIKAASSATHALTQKNRCHSEFTVSMLSKRPECRIASNPGASVRPSEGEIKTQALFKEASKQSRNTKRHIAMKDTSLPAPTAAPKNPQK
jgi:hypothetical protein